ncbi:MAG: FAD-dependent oxidoreductase [Pontiellaceae bacterium]|nr:FAD-dependent oxidoreductase [Pontiellaceae bacterium]
MIFSKFKSSLAVLLATLATAFSAQEPHHDIVVYGGTSGAVAAAVQAARSGRSVVLISPIEHLGGMTSSGLGWTDLGDPDILGGISREFYEAVYDYYQDAAAWDWQSMNLSMSGQSGPAFNSSLGIASIFEPGVAEQIFNDLLYDAGVTLVQGQLDLQDGINKSGTEITSLTLDDGREFPGSIFIDATYEGDLLPGAGVSFVIGREANAAYGEAYNGIQTERAVKNQLPSGIDPYVVPGDSSSGLIAGVGSDPVGTDGAADHRLQSYCYRMVLTDVEANRVMVPQPADYNEADYELLFRAIEAGQTAGFFKFSLMPNRKTDSNNTGGISTDFIGKNYGPDWSWPTLNYAERAAVAKAHENWQRGLIWTLQNHPRVPETIRNSYGSWGLPVDEFTDNDHWPWQIYVREGRRMVSDFVMTEDYCRGVQVAYDSIAMGAYAMDSHNVRRQVVNGEVRNEGDVQSKLSNPYPIAYRAIVPKENECTNLLVPWSLSASHIAFGSIRMEPVFMTLAQSAAIAADLALDHGSSVQQVDYTELRPVLIAAGQALGDPIPPQPETVIDNADAEVQITGSWLSASTTPGFAGSDYLHDNNEGQGTKNVFFPFFGSGYYRVYLRWTSHDNRASNVPIEINQANGLAVKQVDQRSDGGVWNLLGIYPFSGAAGEGVRILNTGANGYVVADAVGFAAIDETTDSDEDGLTDLREVELGLDPDESDAAFVAGIQLHPEYFDLHKESEVQDIFLSGPRIDVPDAATAALQFELQDESVVLEAFDRPLDTTGDRRFFRALVAGQPLNFLTDLASGDHITMIVYGTSLTANGAWVGRLGSWLGAAYPGQVTLINSGLSGKNSAEGVAQLQAKVLDHNPDVIFIEFAMNDAFLYDPPTPSLSVQEARDNLEFMIDSILAENPDCEIILQTMNTVWDSPPPAGSGLSATKRPYLSDYYAMYRSVAADRNLLLIDHHPTWAALQANDLSAFEAAIPDGVHPGAAGLDTYMVPFLKWKVSGGLALP